jgi:hypothetical protein
MGFFGFLFWIAVLWFAFRAWRRWESRQMRRARYGSYDGWYDSGEFYGRRRGSPEAKQLQNVEEQQTYIDALERRVNDLEERLDFTERLLAERRELATQE